MSEKGNIIYSCKEHGVETYFNIKKLERQRRMREYVYVWFKKAGHDEKMWVRITSGDKKNDQHTKHTCLLYTSPSPRDRTRSRMPSSA